MFGDVEAAALVGWTDSKPQTPIHQRQGNKCNAEGPQERDGGPCRLDEKLLPAAEAGAPLNRVAEQRYREGAPYARKTMYGHGANHVVDSELFEERGDQKTDRTGRGADEHGRQRGHNVARGCDADKSGENPIHCLRRVGQALRAPAQHERGYSARGAGQRRV